MQKTAKTKNMVLLTMLAVILVIMAFTPLGYLNIAAINISFNMIPVAIGAIALGPVGGAILGLVFGLISFMRCFGIMPLGTALCAINPFLTFVVFVVPRVLDGFLIGLISRWLNKVSTKRSLNYAVVGLIAALLNTILFMTFLVVCFGQTEVIQGFWQKLAPGANAIVFVAAFVGFNAIVEMIASSVLTTAIGFGLYKAKLIQHKTEPQKAEEIGK